MFTVVVCGVPPTISYAHILGEYKASFLNDTVIFECESGRRFNTGSTTLVAACMRTRSWNYTGFTCESMSHIIMVFIMLLTVYHIS